MTDHHPRLAPEVTRAPGTLPIGTDTLLLLVMVLPMIFFGDIRRGDPISTTITYFLVAAYAYQDVAGGSRFTYPARRRLFTLLVAFLVVVPLLVNILMRYRTGPQYYVHDNPLQIEVAAELLLDGANPYGYDYRPTVMGRWEGYTRPRWSADPAAAPPPDWGVNPALFHVASLPFGFVSMVPLALAGKLVGWWDARIGYLACYLATLWLIGHLVRDRGHRIIALVAIGLNPLLVPHLIDGRNDILTLVLLVAAGAAWWGKRRTLAGVLVGLALASKHTALFFLPFYALLGWPGTLHPRDWLRMPYLSCLARHLLPPLATAALLILPFVVWNPTAFYRDTYGYLAGTLPTSYPLKGIDLGGLAVQYGLVPNARSPLPSTLLQIIFAGPLLVALLLYQIRDNTPKRALAGYAIFLLVYLWFGRFYATNYPGFAVLLLCAAVFWPADRTPAIPESRRQAPVVQ